MSLAEGLPLRTARALDRLAVRLRVRGRYRAAERWQRLALRVAERVLAPTDPELVTFINNLGVLYKYTADFESAEALYARALGIAEALDSNDLTLATLLHNVGGLAHARGRYAEGEPHASRAAEIRERVLGRDHPDTVADVGALAAILDAQGRHGEAEALYRRALASFERALGPDHYEVAVVVGNLAALCQATGRAPEAERLYARALSLKTKLLGPRHPEVATTLNNMAVLCKAGGRYSEAEALYLRAFAIFRRVLEPGHPSLGACLENLANLQRLVGDGASEIGGPEASDAPGAPANVEAL
jgi:tetratricopeptide (TPR) repeat protein